MKNIKVYLMTLLVLLTFTLSSCELVGDIFEAGMWVGIILVVLIIMLIAWLLRKIRR